MNQENFQLFLFSTEQESSQTDDIKNWGTFKDSLRAPVHRWFTYPAGFSFKAVEHSLNKFFITKEMIVIDSVKDNLISLIEKVLDDSTDREVKKVLVELVSNLGEVKVYEFKTISRALEFLEQQDLKELFLTTDSLSLFDPPPEFNN